MFYMKVEKASMDDPAFSDDEDTSIDEATSNLDGQSQHENVVELASNSESSDTATIKTASTPDCYYYYQGIIIAFNVSWIVFTNEFRWR